MSHTAIRSAAMEKMSWGVTGIWKLTGRCSISSVCALIIAHLDWKWNAVLLKHEDYIWVPYVILANDLELRKKYGSRLAADVSRVIEVRGWTGSELYSGNISFTYSLLGVFFGSNRFIAGSFCKKREFARIFRIVGARNACSLYREMLLIFSGGLNPKVD